MPRRTQTLYEEVYKAPGFRIRDHCLPTLPSAAPGFKVVRAHVLKAGRERIDGQELEYQVVKVYLTDKEGSD